MKKWFPYFRLSFRTVLKVLPSAAVLLLLLFYRELFLGPSAVNTAKVVPPLEMHRTAVWVILILLTVLACFDSYRASYGRGAHLEKQTALRSPLSCAATFLLIFLNSVLSFLVIELINNMYLLRMKSQYVWLNTGITFVLYLVIVFALNSRAAGMAAGNAFFLVWGIVNYFVQQFRGIPFQWIDFGSVRTAASVSGNYTYTPTWQMIAGIAVTGAVCGLWLHSRTKRMFRKLPGKIASRAAAAAILFLFGTVIFRTGFLAGTGRWLRDWQPWYTYRLFGMEAGFFAFAKASYPEKPEGFSAEEVKRIISESREEYSASEDGNGGAEGSGAADGTAADTPENIIVVMNESFSDPRIYPAFFCDSELTPFLDSLEENTQKGKLLVSVKGGTTANTEYEFLTGNSCVLSPTTVVYNSFIKQNQFSIARTLAAQGYEVIAMHPYGRYGWNRNVVYPRMGFDTFLSIEESFKDAERVRGFVSDSGDYREIIKIVEAKEKGQKLFIFNITMQNHSAYRNEKFVSDVAIEGFEGTNKGQAEQFCSLIKLSDEALRELIGYFRGSEEKTMILFFGDHQPEIGDDFWEYCYGKPLDDLSFEEQQMQFETRWFLWSNYDIPEKEGLTMSANYLSGYLLQQANLNCTDYNRFLLDQMQGIPAMNAYGYVDSAGNAHQWDTEETSVEAAEQLRRYKCLIYEELTGGSSRDDSFYGIDSQNSK